MRPDSDPFSVQSSGGEIPHRKIHRDTRARDLSESLFTSGLPFPFLVRFPRRVLILTTLVLGSGFLLLFGRLVYLQIVRGAFYRDAAENNRITLERVLPSRGLFYDRNGEVLVENAPNFEVLLTPAEFSFSDADTARLRAVLGISPEELQEKLAGVKHFRSAPIVLLERMGYERAIAADVQLAAIPGVTVNPTAERNYLHGEAFAHILGYVGKITEEELTTYPDYGFTDIVGKTGLEAVYERPLHGEAGEQQVERDFLNNRKRTVARKEPVAGADAYLTLDASVQERAYDALKRTVDRLGVSGGAAVALDPRNGEIRALVSYPSFDPNAFVTGLTPERAEQYLRSDERPLFNRAVAGEYPSGSTIKPAIAVAALVEGIITPYTTVQSTGGLTVGQWFFPDWRPGGHGTTDVYHAIADSVNTFFYMIGGGYKDFTGLGVARITEHLKKFGFSTVLGVDLPGEQEGFLPSKIWKEEVKGERWYIGDTYNLSIGQGDLLVTPLQMASLMSTIANGGTLYRPHAVAQLKYPSGEVVKPEDTVLNFQVEDRDAIQVVQKALRQTVTQGSARALANFPVPLAAKTGTAQFGDGSATHAWFTAYGPYENPEIALAVIVEAGGEGSARALPIAREMLSAYFGV